MTGSSIAHTDCPVAGFLLQTEPSQLFQAKFVLQEDSGGVERSRWIRMQSSRQLQRQKTNRAVAATVCHRLHFISACSCFSLISQHRITYCTHSLAALQQIR